MSSEAARNRWATAPGTPTKPSDVQAAMKTHLSQPTGVGAFDGQHGMSLAISSAMADADISSAIACIDASEDISAMTGRETGANARPAITMIASSRRMVKFRFTKLDSRNLVAIARRPAFHIMDSVRPELIGIKADRRASSLDYLSDRPITAISSAIFSRWSALLPLVIACSTQCDT
jgi:hypothetical protein